MATNNSPNFLTLNTLAVERLQDEDQPAGYDYNRIVDALNGLRTGVVDLSETLVNGILYPLYYSESVNAAHPMFLDFMIANGVTPTIANISWKMRLFRSTSLLTTSTSAVGESGHSHDHNHDMWHSGGVSGGTAFQTYRDGVTSVGSIGTPGGAGPATYVTYNDVTGSSGHTHSHSHTITLGITESGSTTVAALLIDGVDKTASLGGPWAGDVVRLNLGNVLPTGDNAWHTIQLTPAGTGRIVSILEVPM